MSVDDRVRPGYLEDKSVCGFWTERFLSAFYHFFAGRPDAARVAGLAAVERIAFVTKDHKQLGGYKLQAYAEASRSARSYVLVALGNAMLADVRDHELGHVTRGKAQANPLAFISARQGRRREAP